MIPSGLTNQEETRWICDRAEERLVIAEIGSYIGELTLQMAFKTRGTVYAIDLWDTSLLPDNAHYQEFRDHPADWFFYQFLERMSGALEVGKVKMVRLPSVEAAKSLEAVSFDMVFIDASHDYESVKADILAWRPLLKIGGLLCGHDFEEHRGVPQAVRELVPNFKLGPGSIWYV